MRILACNPDTIGDVVLRQPMYRAIMDAGHELMLIVRPLLLPVMDAVAPGARVATFEDNLYDPRLAIDDATLEPHVAAARRFSPDTLLIAPFQWTVLEERLSRDLAGVRCVALSGRRFSDPSFGPAPEASLRTDCVVEVSEDTPETRKNEFLAGAVLGRAVKLKDPSIEPGAAHLTAADAVLSRLGLAPGGYWAACVGDTEHTAVRNWRPQRWADAMAAWARAGAAGFS